MIRKYVVLLLMFILPICFLGRGLFAGQGDLPTLDKERAGKFAAMALKCIEQEYPNKLSHVMNDQSEVLGPKALHPVFYGCFDWHSSVHGHWMLIRLLKKFPGLETQTQIRAALNRNITAENVAQEVAYLHQKSRNAFERTYGWAWLLKLVEELHQWQDEDGKRWRGFLAPLEKELVLRYMDFLPKQTYAIRTGVHPNTAFGIAFALDYATTVGNMPLKKLLVERSNYYYAGDKNCPVSWEPGGEDFFSPCLMEASLMQRVLPEKDFPRWFHQFMPTLKNKHEAILTPAVVTDRTDGKLVHLDGVNLSRAWCMKRIARGLSEKDPVRGILSESLRVHAESALANIHSGDYAGEHWLASFAVYLLTD